MYIFPERSPPRVCAYTRIQKRALIYFLQLLPWREVGRGPAPRGPHSRSCHPDASWYACAPGKRSRPDGRTLKVRTVRGSAIACSAAVNVFMHFPLLYFLQMYPEGKFLAGKRLRQKVHALKKQNQKNAGAFCPTVLQKQHVPASSIQATGVRERLSRSRPPQDRIASSSRIFANSAGDSCCLVIWISPR